MQKTGHVYINDKRATRFWTPGASMKRKERGAFDTMKPSTAKKPKPSIARAGSEPDHEAADHAPSNHLLAGYFAHEFLTKGTLFGQPWDPARAGAVPLSAPSSELRRPKSGQKTKPEPSSMAEPQVEKHQGYVEVADLLRVDGVHLRGVVNPTQLGRLFNLG